MNDLIAGAGSQLNYTAIHDLNLSSKIIQINNTTAERDANAKAFILNLGCAWARNESLSLLNGKGANSDMLSITGMTLEQFCNLMNGLGYHSEKGERLKIKTVPMNETNDRVEREVAVEGVLAEESTKVPNSDKYNTLMAPTNKIDKKSNMTPDLHLVPVLDASDDAIQSNASTSNFVTMEKLPITLVSAITTTSFVVGIGQQFGPLAHC
jgi:hypothetical protein